MINEEKKQIERLRNDGLGYGKISSMLGLSKSTVSSFCKSLESGLVLCPVCGAKVKVKKNCRPRKYCSLACKNEYWKINYHKANRKHNAEFTCLCCGKKFTGYKSKNSKFCSRECYLQFKYGGKAHEAK